MSKLIVILPCFNEEDVIVHSAEIIDKLLLRLIDQNLISDDSYALYVDDGSRDATWSRIQDLAGENNRIRGLRLSRNFGHQLALAAGMREVNGTCDACVSIDADLQQDPDTIEIFLEKFRDGADVVLGLRRDRDTDGWLKRSMAGWFYALARRLGVDLIPGHADFRLLSARALSIACEYEENDPFFRGLVPLIGLHTETVLFDVRERSLGQSKYTFRKMFRLGLTGITSFSIMPLRIIGVLGVLVLFLSIVLSGHVLWVRLFTDAALPGWASTVIPIYLIAGLQMMSFGIIGEYVGRIFLEVKRRPTFTVMERTDA